MVIYLAYVDNFEFNLLNNVEGLTKQARQEIKITTKMQSEKNNNKYL